MVAQIEAPAACLDYDFALEIRVSCVNVAKENDSHEPRVLTDGRFRILDASAGV